MGMRYCDVCKKGFATTETVSYKGYYFCTKCKKPTLEIGEEAALVTISEPEKEAGSAPKKEDHSLKKVGNLYKIPDIDLDMLQVEDALVLNPENTEALLTLANLQFKKGLAEVSRDTAEKILVIEPNHTEAQQFLIQNFEKEDADAILKNNPENVDDLYKIAQSFVQKSQPKEARKVFEKIIQLSTRHLGARRFLAELSLKEQRFRDAINHLSILKLLKPKDPFIHYNLAIASFHDGDMERALAAFHEAFENSDDPAFRAEIAGFIKQIEAQ